MSKEAKKQKATNGETGMSDVLTPTRSESVDPFSWMGDWLDHWPSPLGRRVPEFLGRSLSLDNPIRVEEFIADDELVVRAEIPGLDPDDDIDVTVADGKLTIAGHRERRSESERDGRTRTEFHYGSFRRVMDLPSGVEAGQVEASYERGVLEVRIPINRETEASTKIPISRKD